ncbi:hypothetical protein NL108_003042 [Boleophthalmus pectinirostris]|uniref:bloodthirsty-related gene family, member 2 n=1 Tax=Boleophthalmus pectinirostris TaxID=150288 RepID=UPI00242FB20D|nr:bloodthirsty-related gene family, member 2 [Boleophthalmus pectinirostris]KAJ0057897.1 hypothetical protein NL108_003042 [Boleophthalmus pectinirostris]
MASPISLLSERHFLCTLCRKIFTNPVTIPCGHSFCLSCLSHFWSKHMSRYCPHCKRLFTERPNLSINHVLADVSEKYSKIRPPKEPEENTVVFDVEQMVQERLQKIERLKNCLEQQKNSYLREVRESQKTFSALVSAMEKSHKAVVTAIEERQREEEKRVAKLIKELEQEIQELTKDISETEPTTFANEEPSDETEQGSVPPCPPEMKDWSRVTVEPDPCIGVTRRALWEMVEKIKAEVNRLSKSELKRIEKYTVDIYLSAKTAHPALSVSEDRKQVRHTDKLQEVSENPKRFDRVANILAKESFGNGRYYWEVEVGEKIEWNLGVVRQSINRKGKFTVCPSNGFWTLSLKASGQYLANSSPVTHLALDYRPKRVGVFLDYSEGQVSFYCAESGAHIYTFNDKFTDRLHPFFSPGRLHGGKNAVPLILSSSFCSI